jgi:uncharacterized membrane protein
MKYYYPDNLESPAMCGFWTAKDAVILAGCSVVSVLLLAYFLLIIPLVCTVAFAFMRIQFGDITIFGYITKVGSFLLTKQQRYYWEVQQTK